VVTHYGRRHRGHLYRGGSLLHTPQSLGSFAGEAVDGRLSWDEAPSSGSADAIGASIWALAGAIEALVALFAGVSRSWMDILMHRRRRPQASIKIRKRAKQRVCCGGRLQIFTLGVPWGDADFIFCGYDVEVPLPRRRDRDY
jgi:hypothetical protein